MLLADLYLKNGRFLSAEHAYSDVLTLDPVNARAGLTRTLAMIGQGKSGEAMLELDRLAGTASPGDVGLAFALAGQAQRAIEILEPAARAPEANARVRQNLALAYALAGDWQRARTVGAQDLSAAELGKRLEQWAALANPATPYSQVAAILGVSPVEDAGRPTRLALAPEAPRHQASAETSAPESAPPAPVRFAAAETPAAVGGPVEEVAEEKPESFAYTPPAHTDLFAPPVDTAAVAVPAPSAPAKTDLVEPARFAAAVASLVDAPVAQARQTPAVAKAPIMAFTPEKAAPVAVTRKTGRYVVQIGAYRNASQVEQAWARLYKQYPFGETQPLSTTVTIPGKGTFHRLAVSGFDRPADASRLCHSIRSKGGSCFVRATAGDAPVRWASRYSARA
jgi:hypothetical protein